MMYDRKQSARDSESRPCVMFSSKGEVDDEIPNAGVLSWKSMGLAIALFDGGDGCS